MGRPINKRKIGLGSGKIAVTSARFATGGVQTDNENGVRLYIYSQRSDKQFLIKSSDGTYSEQLKLVGKATPAAGEFNIKVTLDNDADATLNDSTIYWVVSLHNRTVSCQPDNDPSMMIKIKYTLGDETTDEGLLGDGFTIANIDAQ